MTVTLYAKPEGTCVPCTATERALVKHGIEFTKIDITEDQNALDYILSLGHRAAPVVVAGDKNWSGFRPELIAELVA